jgi:predicted kinase
MPMLIAMAGLPASGKSYLGQALAAALPACILDKDVIRAALFPPGELEYSTEQDDFCLSVMLEVAEYILQKDPAKIVILDGRPFVRRYQRAQVTTFAASHAITLLFIECVCSDETARSRLLRSAASNVHLARNRDYALYLKLKAAFEPIEEPKLLVNTDHDLQACLATALAYVRGQAGNTFTG